MLQKHKTNKKKVKQCSGTIKKKKKKSFPTVNPTAVD